MEEGEGGTFGDLECKAIQAAFDHFKWNIDFDKVISRDRSEVVRVLQGFIALEFKIFLHLTEEFNQTLVDLIIENKEDLSHASQRVTLASSAVLQLGTQSQDSQTSQNAVHPIGDGHDDQHSKYFLLERESGIIPSNENFMIAVSTLPEISAYGLGRFFITFYNCIQATNLLVNGLRQHSSEKLKKVIDFIQTPMKSTSGTYCVGPIRTKEPHTYLYETPSVGSIQIGIPPETIKTSIKKGETVPKIYVLPPSLFSGDNFYGEVEFPLYFNYFIKKAFQSPENRIILIGTQECLKRTTAIFKESYYGPNPDEYFLDEEIAPGRKAMGYKPDLAQEAAIIASISNPKRPVTPFEEFANCIPFDSDGIASFTQKSVSNPEVEVKVTIQHHSGLLQFFEDDQHVASLELDITPHAHDCKHKQETANSSGDIDLFFEPPTFGITFLGTSHGFDAKGHTTGFVIWLNGEGILVDPPPYTTSYLRSHGIPASIINKVILTHCHSDHDSGLLMKILDGEKIELFTTKTINEMYKRKLFAVTGFNAESFYEFSAVPIGLPFTILGASFEFDYSFHTVPTLRFKAQYGGRSISYSSDTFYDPEVYAQLRIEKKISSERERSLNLFLFDADVIIHECGIPPIHTNPAVLNELPLSIKKKLFVVHCSGLPSTVDKVLMDGTKVTVPVKDLKIPATGLEETIRIGVGQYMEGVSQTTRRFKIFSSVLLFQQLSPSIVFELFSKSEEQRVKAGEMIIESGSESDLFYIIYNGTVEVFKEMSKDAKPIAILRRGDAFGENALRVSSAMPRTAFIVAKTDCILLKLAASAYRKVMKIEGLMDEQVSKLTIIRPWIKEALAQTYLFQDLPEVQVNSIALSMEERKVQQGTTIITEGESDNSMFIILFGSVKIYQKNPDVEGVSVEVRMYEKGQVFGELALLTGETRSATIIANEDSLLLELKKEPFQKLLNQYQNLRAKLMVLVDSRKRIAHQTKQLLSSSST